MCPSQSRLLLNRRLYWANLGASTTIYTGICVNYIFTVPFTDSGNGTFAFAGATGDTFVGDFIRQTYHLLYIDLRISARIL